MTIPKITDEVLAEIEDTAEASLHGCHVWLEPDGYSLSSMDLSDIPYVVAISPSRMLNIITELRTLRAELESCRRDAGRWRYARDLLHPDDIRDFQAAFYSFGMKPTEEISAQCDAAIDVAMQEQAK